MKIMYVSNNEKYRYDTPTICDWNQLPSLFTQKGHHVLGVGKHELKSFYKKYKEFNPDIIIVDWIPASVVPLLYKKLGLIKCPIVHTWGDYYKEMMTNYPSWLTGFLEQYTVKKSDFIITVSKYNQKRAQKLGKRVYYIPHGVSDVQKSTNINLNDKLLVKSNLKVVYLGEQSKWKKTDEIIKAVEGLDCELFLIGETNPEFIKLKYWNTHFLEKVPPEEVRAVLQQADILINPSNQDCNYKFFEYIRAGKPILAYDDLPRYLFTHRKNAFLTKDFKAGLRELILSPSLRYYMEQEVKKIETFSWDNISEKYLELIKVHITL